MNEFDNDYIDTPWQSHEVIIIGLCVCTALACVLDAVITAVWVAL